MRIAILGAGPFGLATAAYLRDAGFDPLVFGTPMAFWREHMPEQMLLRSFWDGSHIADPERRLTLDAYQRATGRDIAWPIPVSDFIGYGEWFASSAAPYVDRRLVMRVDLATAGFRLVLNDGDELVVDKVVVATGVASFPRWPDELRHLPETLVTHSSSHRDFSCMRGRSVVVVGGGQSALETAAILAETGAHVEVVVRAPAVHWLHAQDGTRGLLHTPHNPLRSVVAPPSAIGPIGISLLVDRPRLFRMLPPGAVRSRVATRALRPAGARWLVPRLAGVRIHTESRIAHAVPRGDRLHLRLQDGTDRLVDHVVLGTGFEVDISRSPYLPAATLARIDRRGGYPLLRPGLESSLPGMYFVGASAVGSFGPLMRFVAGTRFAARMVTRHLSASASRWPAPRALYTEPSAAYPEAAAAEPGVVTRGA